MRNYIIFLLTQSVVFLILFLGLSILFYSYFLPYLFVNLLETFVFVFLFYASWLSLESNVEIETDPKPPVPTNLLILIFLANIFFASFTVHVFINSSSIEFAITNVFLPTGSTAYLINGSIISLYLPTLLRDRNIKGR